MIIEDFKKGFIKIRNNIEKNKDYLTKLDQVNGDGDLGISMSNGFGAVANLVETNEYEDLGILLNQAGNTFNENAPSSLGTVISFILKGMARYLKGKNQCSSKELGEALLNGINVVSEKTGSKLGDKTILDALIPATNELINNDINPFATAAKEAKEGSERTKDMVAKFGRASYQGENSIGNLDGGSEVGAIIFESLL